MQTLSGPTVPTKMDPDHGQVKNQGEATLTSNVLPRVW